MIVDKIRQIASGDILRALVASALLIGAGAYIVFDIGVDMITDAFLDIDTAAIAMATLAVCLAVLLTCFRYKMILSTFGIAIGWRSAFFANLIGIFGGLLFFQIVGQTLTRAAVLRRYGIPTTTVLISNLYERFIALAWLTVMATLGALMLYGSIAVDWSGNSVDLAKLLTFGPPAIILGIYGSSRRIIRLLWTKMHQAAPFFDIATSSGLTIATHLSTLMGYIFLLHNQQDVSIAALASATIVVMFASSLPISFAGWGIRELSAALAFSMVGVETETAVAVALVIGLINLAILILAIVIGMAISGKDNSRDKIVPAGQFGIHGANNRVLTRVLSWGVPILCAIFVMMQLQIPIGKGAVNINAGDPLALLGGFIFFLSYFQQSKRHQYWRLPGFEVFYFGITAVLVFSFVVGLAQHGLIDWALINRLIGWGVILGFLATGALITTQFGYAGQIAFARCFVLATTAIVSLDILFIAINATVQFNKIPWLGSIVAYGLSNNPNSFSLQVLFSIVLLTTMPLFRSKNSLVLALIIAIAAAGVFYAKSRTGHGTLIILVLFLLMIQAMNFRLFFKTLAIFSVILAMPFIFFHASVKIPQLVASLSASLSVTEHSLGEPNTTLPNNFMIGTYQVKKASVPWDDHRWYSINTGIEMWKENPIVGAGLGAFIHTETQRSGTPLVIHSTPVWVLTELGLIGFILVYGAGIFFVIKVLPAAWVRAGPQRALLGVFLVFAVYQLPHDIFYQRAFWLILGCLGATLLIKTPAIDKSVRPALEQPLPTRS